ncbi:MAG: hypothetical protein Q9213_003255 [Squamulea squamosa]
MRRKADTIQPQSSAHSSSHWSAGTFWRVFQRRDLSKPSFDEPDIDSNLKNFHGPASVLPPITNGSLPAPQAPETPADNIANFPPMINGNPSIASDPPVPMDLDSFTPPPAFLASTTSFQPPPDACKQCWIFYKWAHIYYPPAETSNTLCLTALTAAPTPHLPPLELEPKSGYAYVVLPTLSAEIDCKPITTYTSQTFSFPPGQLFTQHGPGGLQNLTREFNFRDLPCPPPDIAAEAIWFYNPEFNPTRRYSPFIAPFSEIWDLDPKFKSLPCTVALNQGMDPPVPLSSAGRATPPKGLLGQHLRRDGLQAAHRVPNLPVETNPPFTG